MSLIDIRLQRRPKSFRPTFEVLEERQCMSVSAPTLQLTAIAPTQVKLNWTNVAGENGYRVYRWTGTQTVLVTALARDVTTLTVGQLQPNQTQWFIVEAFDASTVARSSWKSIMTPANAIAAPTNFRVVGVTQSQINLAWNNATGATGYRIFGWDGAKQVLLGTTTPTVPAFTASNLAPGTVYYFYVQAFNATNIANTAWINGTTSAAGITAPTNFKATVQGASTIALSWNDVAGETGYRIYQTDGTTTGVIATLAANTTGHQVTGLLPGRTYQFYVQAFTGTSSANSTPVTATTAAALPLQAPTQLTFQVTGPNSVYLSWVEPARAVGYRVLQWTGFGWSNILTVPAGTNKVPITGLRSNWTHWFAVQAFTDNNAEIAYSAVAFVNL